jgi:hypothetical protein
MNVIAIGHNRLDFIKRRMIAGHDRLEKGGAEWIEGSLELAAALLDGREAMPADIGFSQWLKQNQLDFYNKNDRSALIGLASDLSLARQILGKTTSRSYQIIWHENKTRFPSVGKPPKRQMSRPRTRKPGRAMLHRRMKLGDEVVDKLKGTSLDSAAELDELVMLNRGAPEGELTEIVARLVDEATAGKDVSAIAETKKISGRGLTVPKLIAAWRKRMVAPWRLANKAEQGELIEYLMNDWKGDEE